MDFWHKLNKTKVMPSALEGAKHIHVDTRYF